MKHKVKNGTGKRVKLYHAQFFISKLQQSIAELNNEQKKVKYFVGQHIFLLKLQIDANETFKSFLQ